MISLFDALACLAMGAIAFTLIGFVYLVAEVLPWFWDR